MKTSIDITQDAYNQDQQAHDVEQRAEGKHHWHHFLFAVVWISATITAASLLARWR